MLLGLLWGGLALILGARLGAQANPNGFITSGNWLVLGPFFETHNCSGFDETLMLQFLAPSSIHNLTPSEGDVIDFDPRIAASSAYLGPLRDGKPVWRLLDDGTDDDDLDLDLELLPLGLTGTTVMSYVVTYFQYLGATPIDATLCVGSDDDVQVWLDEGLIYNNSACRGRAFCQDSPAVKIVPGTHRIAMGIWEQGGGWGGSLGIQVDGNAITDDAPDWRFLGVDRKGFSLPQDGVFHRELDSPSRGHGACPRGSGGPLRVRIQADLPPGVTSVASIMDVASGAFGPAQVAATGGAVVSAKPPLALTPLGSFADARFIGRNPICAESERNGLAFHDGGGLPAPGDDVYVLENIGADIWTEGDSFTFAYNRVEGDFTFTARVKERQFVPASRWGKFGPMARQDLTTRSRYAMVQDHGEDLQDALRFAARPTHGANDNFEKIPLSGGTHHDWMRLVRRGETLTGYSAPEGIFDGEPGVDYFEQGSIRMPGLPPTLLVGLAACSHTTSCQDDPMSIAFDEVSLEGNVVPVHSVPDGVEVTWTNVSRESLAAGLGYEIDLEMGSVTFDGQAGSAPIVGEARGDLLPPLVEHGPIADPAFPHVHAIGKECEANAVTNPAPGEIVLAGGGRDIWGWEDQFLYAYGEVSGDFSARVTITSRDWVPESRWGRAGIMARQDCTRAARCSMIADSGENPAEGVRFEGRLAHGESQYSDYYDHPFVGQHADTLRLDRCGDTLTGYVLSEEDPQNPGQGTFGAPIGEWVKIGSQVWDDAPDQMLLGLAVVSYAVCYPATIGFNDWSVTPGCTGGVQDLACTETPTGLRLSWRNPPGADTTQSISVRVGAEKIASLEGIEASFDLDFADIEALSTDPAATISVVNASGIPAKCTYPVGFSSQGFINHWLLLGPFAQRGGAAPGDDVLRLDYLADGAGTTELSVQPRAGDTVRPDYGGAAASLSLLRTPVRPELNPGGVPTWTELRDPDERIELDYFADSFTRANDDYFMVHAVTYLEVEEDMSVDLGVASNDAIQVLLDGKEVHVNSAERWEGARDAVLDIVSSSAHAELSPLTAGHHTLMVKQFEGSGNCAFRFRFQDETGTPLTRGIKVRLTPPGPVFHRGDSNNDGKHNISDPVNTLSVLFLGSGAIPCRDAADSNDDGQVNISDPVNSLNVLFLGTGAVPPPSPPEALQPCGADPTADAPTDLGCETYDGC